MPDLVITQQQVPGKRRGRPPKYDLSNFHCWNSQCQYHMLKDHGNIVACGFHDGMHRFKCKACGQSFTETRGTILWKGRPKDQVLIEHALQLIAYGEPIKAVARLLNISPRRIQRWLERVRCAPRGISVRPLEVKELRDRPTASDSDPEA